MTDVNHVRILPDFTEEMYDLLKHQFKDKTLIKALFETVADMKAIIQEESVNLAELRLLDIASGVVLNDIGEFLGLDRGTSSDEEYRAALKVRVFRKRNQGTRSNINEVISRATGSPAESFNTYRGNAKDVDIAFFLGCLDSSGVEEIVKMFPVVTNYRVLAKPVQKIFGYTSIHKSEPPKNVYGYGTIHELDTLDVGRYCRLLARRENVGD